MPKWVIHNYTARNFCNLSEDICDEINRFIDSNPLEHDVNRIIVDGLWIPEALLYLGIAVYEKWGYKCPKCHGRFGFYTDPTGKRKSFVIKFAPKMRLEA